MWCEAGSAAGEKVLNESGSSATFGEVVACEFAEYAAGAWWRICLPVGSDGLRIPKAYL